MKRNEESKQGGYSANLYITVLDENIPNCFNPGMSFMQDNA
jgi:hypothetical protein